MTAFIQNIMPQLIDDKASIEAALFTTKNWLIQYSNKPCEKYSFYDSGTYSISSKQKGQWAYSDEEKMLHLYKQTEKLIFKLLYNDLSVVVFQDCAEKGTYLLMIDANKLKPDQIEPYFRSLYYRINKIATLQLDQKLVLEIHQYNPKVGFLNNKVSINGIYVKDGIYKGNLSKRKILVRQHKIIKVLVDKTYKTSQGTIVIEKQELHKPQVGDAVFKDGLPAEDGIYLLGFQTIIVRNGRIIN